MKKHLILYTTLCCLVACTAEKKDPARNAAAATYLTPPQRTLLAELPDSLQPKVFELASMPKLQRVTVPKSGRSSYVSLVNGKPQTILLQAPPRIPVSPDRQGKPASLGNGAVSLFDIYDTENGLNVDGATCSLMDSKGNLWFGSPGAGVSRFDAVNFTSFSTEQGLPHNSVAYMMEDQHGHLWFGTDGGISIYDGTSFTNISSKEGLIDDIVRCIFQDKQGIFWIGTRSGLSRYNPDPTIKKIKDRFTNFNTTQGLPHNSITAIFQDKRGYIWVGTNEGLCRFDPKKIDRSGKINFAQFTSEQGLINNNIRCITADLQGNLWFGTLGGLSKYDGKTFTNFTTAEGLLNNQIKHITVDSLGQLWISVNVSGFSKYDGKSFTNFTTAQGLNDDDVACTTLDRAGNLWICTRHSGIHRYRGSAFTYFTKAQGIVSDAIFTILEDQSGKLWLGSESLGFSAYDGQTFNNYTTAQGLLADRVTSGTLDSSQHLWFGCDFGVSEFDGQSFTHYTKAQGLPANRIQWLYTDAAKNIWIASDQGIAKFDGKSFTHFTKSQGLPVNDVLSVAEDKLGNIWFGTLGGGISRYDGQSFTNFSTAQGLLYDDVYSITLDKNGNLWFGTDVGISRISAQQLAQLATVSTAGSKGKYQSIFDNFTTAEGLADHVIYDVEQDGQGNIMIGTNKGITLIPAAVNELPFAQIRPHLEYFNVANGYPIKDVNTSAMYRDHNGYMWIGTSNGLFRFDYASLPKVKSKPTLILEKIKINETDICWFDLQQKGLLNNRSDSARAMLEESLAYGKMLTQPERDTFAQRFRGIRFSGISPFYPLPQKLVLPHLHNHITFHFKAIDTDQPLQLQYQYILEGYDQNWSPATKNTSASFGNMGGGQYTFKVRTRRGNGAWSEPVSYTFQVKPPWYLSWWAFGFYALILWASLRTFIRWRGRTLIKEKEKLEAAVQERTAELSQRLEELATVNQVSRGLVSQLHLDELFSLVGDEMRRLFKANIVYIAVHDKASDMIHFPYEYGDSTPSRKFGNGLTEKIIRSRQPILENQDSQVRNKVLQVDQLGVSSKSYLGVPIMAADEVIGVLSVQSTQQENRFKEDDLRLLNTIAANVGIAMHNAQLFDEAQQARAQAEEANEAKSSFLSTISHELRTPLTSVIGFAKIIRKRLEEKIFPLLQTADSKVQRSIEQISDNLKVVISEGERLTTLINDVLDLAKIEAGRVEWKMEEVSLEALIERARAVTSSLFAEKNLGVQLEVQAGLPLVVADHDRILQVLINLLSNAVKFTNKGKVFLRARQEQDQLVVSITDTGIGIAPEDQAKVFEKFKQAGDTLTDKPKGTGLGLPICKEIVEHHGGQLWLESQVGVGSTFSFSLPIQRTGIKPLDLEKLMQQLREQVGASSGTKRNGPAEILVVDDEQHIRNLLRQELSEEGYRVLEASNGREAIEITRQEHPDLIILDVMMPEMNGFDVAAVLKNDPKTLDIPILILSIVQDQERGYRLGIDRYLTKPIDTEKLFAEVSTLIGQGKSQKKVMVVDENSSTVKTLADVLQERGYQVVESNGAELLEKALSNRPDIIILSSQLGEQQEVVKTLRFERGLENVLFLMYE